MLDIRFKTVAHRHCSTRHHFAAGNGADSAKLELIFKHELAHEKRRDLAWNWLGALAHALFWFNPLAWVCEREANFAQEVACDELALRNAPERASEFAALLVEIAIGRERVPQLSTVSIIRTKNTLERRLKAMKSLQLKRSHSIAAIAVALLALTPALVPWRVVAQKSDAPTVTEPAEAETKPVDPKQSKPGVEDELLLQEIAIAQQRLDAAKRAQENGGASIEEVVKKEHELLRLQQEQVILTSKARSALQQELKTLEQLQAETAKRVEIGAASKEDKLKADLEVLKLKRELAVLDQNNLPPSNKPADATAAAMKYYKSDPELMKRYFPDMYAIMAKSGGTNLQISNNKPRSAEDVNSRLDRGPRILLKSTRSGVVESVFVKPGYHVSRGQELMRLVDREAAIRLKAAEAEFQIAEADHELKKRELVAEQKARDRNTTPPGGAGTRAPDLEIRGRRLDSELTLAHTKLEQARLDFESLTIRAPSNGTIGALPLVGQMVAPDTELVAFLPDLPKENWRSRSGSERETALI